jgi:hypothetical protein
LLEEVLKDNHYKRIGDVLVLVIHAGSLLTMLYLTRTYPISNLELNQFLVNSAKLDKEKLAFFFIRKGALVIEDSEEN